ncbi:MAG: archaemetzincin, partial [Myxococcota bacterium]
LPKDGVGLLAITEADLYIPSLNFVFGLGSTQDRVSVFSTHRLGHDYTMTGNTGTVLKRSLTVAIHEVGHVLGMRHCTAFNCIMNGNSSLEEADSHPLHLCPVCIRKAEHGAGFDRPHRYQRLEQFYDRYTGFDKEAEFIYRRLNPPKLDHISNL